MKRTGLPIFILTLLWSCNQTTSDQRQEKTASTDTTTSAVGSLIAKDSKIDEYTKYVAQLDSTDAASSTKAAIKFNELFAGQTTALCDSGFLIFNDLYENLEGNLNRIHLDDTTNYYPLVMTAEEGEAPKLSKKLVDYDQKLRSNGFAVTSEEGDTYIEQDGDFIAKHFYPFLSKPMTAYLTQLNKETKEGFSADAGLSISPTQLADRLIWIEDFLNANPAFVFRSRCLELKKMYLTYLLVGMENTSVYEDAETKTLAQDFAEGYEHLLSKYPTAETTKTIKPYYIALKQNQPAKAEELLKQYTKEKKIINFNE